MKILWISSLAWKRRNGYQFDVKTAGAVSGSLFEQKMIEGIERFGHQVDILNAYPYCDSKNHKPFAWSHNDLSDDYCISQKRFKLLNILNEVREFKKNIRKRQSFNYDCVIVYLLHLPFLTTLKYIKKKFGISTVVIVPDLSDMMDLGTKKFSPKFFLKKIESHYLNKCYPFVDKYVFFSQHMSERINADRKPSVVIEGINSLDSFNEFVQKEKPFIVLYAGSLQYNFGLEKIMESFSFIEDNDVELHIYGSGALCNVITRYTQKDCRIKFYGFVNHDVVVQKEREASLLINARDPNELFTKYSFPSKTFEYMMSGTPFLTTKLMGMPDEYFNYLFTLDSCEPKAIAEAILKIKNADSLFLKKRVEDGEQFLLKKKNYIEQSSRLLSFIEK